jgi:hypothetical protein
MNPLDIKANGSKLQMDDDNVPKLQFKVKNTIIAKKWQYCHKKAIALKKCDDFCCQFVAYALRPSSEMGPSDEKQKEKIEPCEPTDVPFDIVKRALIRPPVCAYHEKAERIGKESRRGEEHAQAIQSRQSPVV